MFGQRISEQPAAFISMITPAPRLHTTSLNSPTHPPVVRRPAHCQVIPREDEHSRTSGFPSTCQTQLLATADSSPSRGDFQIPLGSQGKCRINSSCNLLQSKTCYGTYIRAVRRSARTPVLKKRISNQSSTEVESSVAAVRASHSNDFYSGS